MIVDVLVILLLVALSALFSGLNLGLMGLNVYELERKIKLGHIEAAKVYPIRRKGNLLLTTLLLGNVLVNVVLSIFLADMATGLIATVVATGLIFLFGEIIPQSVISRHALRFGAATAPVVKFVIVILWPLCAPIAFILDSLLGNELPQLYTKKELAALIAEHEDHPESKLDRDEERILHGALGFSDKRVEEIMTPRPVVEMVAAEQEISREFLQHIASTGHSRFPTYSHDVDNVVGVLHIRDLLGEGQLGKVVGDVAEHKPVFVREKMRLDTLLNYFIKKKQHLFIVDDEFGGFVGVVTMEDLIEEILQVEIVDEDDVHPDLRAHARLEATREE